MLNQSACTIVFFSTCSATLNNMIIRQDMNMLPYGGAYVIRLLSRKCAAIAGILVDCMHIQEYTPWMSAHNSQVDLTWSFPSL